MSISSSPAVRICCALAAALCMALSSSEVHADVRVVQVTARMAALGTDLQLGDVLATASGPSLTPQMFRQLEWTMAQSGPLALQRQRAGQWQSVTLPAGEWAVDVVDVDAQPGTATLDVSNAAQRESQLRERWRQARQRSASSAAWGIALLRELARHGNATDIQTLLPEVFADASEAERVAALYAVHSALTPQALRDWTQQAQASSPALASDPALVNLTILAYAQLRDLPATESNATALFEDQADSLWGMRAALALALNAFRQQDPAGAEAWLAKAEALAARIAPKGLDAANAQVLRGVIDDRLGRPGGMATLENGLQRLRVLDPNSPAHGRAAFNAHFIALSQTPRDLILAERYAREALEVMGRAAPASNAHAQARAALADVLWRQLQLTEAELLFTQAWRDSKALDPVSYETLSTRLQLAQVWHAQGRFDEAIAASRDIEAAWANLPADHPVRGMSLLQDLLRFRAGWYLDAGDGAAAQADLTAALHLSNKPARPDLILLLADAERLQGNWHKAQAHLETLREQLGEADISRLDGVELALTEARLQRDQGQSAAALTSYRHAIDLLGTAREKAASREDLRARWASRFQALFKEPLAMLMGENAVAEVATLEAQYRWQASRALLGDGPASATLPWPTAAPRAIALERDQVLLSLVVLPDSTVLLVYTADQAVPTLFALPVGQAQWRERIRRWRTLLAAPDAPAVAHAAQRQGHALYRDLFGQLPAEIRAKSRWVIVPDADLHDLPWAALVVNDTPEPVYLIERASIALAASVDSFNLLTDRPNTGLRAVGAGDAVGSTQQESDTPQQRQTGAQLGAARDEVLALREVFGPDTRIALGQQASEAWLREQARTARWLHVAVHGLLDRENPLRSQLLLSSGSGAGDDDGRISAAEVMAQWSLPGSVVTLSACDSALGQAFGGEGLQGLVQALQLAGAKTVFGTLWAVDDASTGWLMRALQPRIAKGEDLDSALAASQRDWLKLAREADASWWHAALATLGLAERLPTGAAAPYFWAGLSVHGATRSETTQ
jgi:CHAT domain-containing protein